MGFAKGSTHPTIRLPALLVVRAVDFRPGRVGSRRRRPLHRRTGGSAGLVIRLRLLGALARRRGAGMVDGRVIQPVKYRSQDQRDGDCEQRDPAGRSAAFLKHRIRLHLVVETRRAAKIVITWLGIKGIVRKAFVGHKIPPLVLKTTGRAPFGFPGKPFVNRCFPTRSGWNLRGASPPAWPRAKKPWTKPGLS